MVHRPRPAGRQGWRGCHRGPRDRRGAGDGGVRRRGHHRPHARHRRDARALRGRACASRADGAPGAGAARRAPLRGRRARHAADRCRRRRRPAHGQARRGPPGGRPGRGGGGRPRRVGPDRRGARRHAGRRGPGQFGDPECGWSLRPPGDRRGRTVDVRGHRPARPRVGGFKGALRSAGGPVRAAVRPAHAGGCGPRLARLGRSRPGARRDRRRDAVPAAACRTDRDRGGPQPRGPARDHREGWRSARDARPGSRRPLRQDRHAHRRATTLGRCRGGAGRRPR